MNARQVLASKTIGNNHQWEAGFEIVTFLKNPGKFFVIVNDESALGFNSLKEAKEAYENVKTCPKFSQYVPTGKGTKTTHH